MPEINQSFVVTQPRDRVWALFQDLPRVVGCIPGASLDGPPQNGLVNGHMAIKLGPVKANFAGEATVAADVERFAGVIDGVGRDKKHGSRAKGKVDYRLEDTDNATETRVIVSVNYTLGGTLAQVARGGIVDAVATQITNEFTANINREMAADNEAESVDKPADTDSTSVAPENVERRQNELNVFGLIWGIVRNWMGRILSRN